MRDPGIDAKVEAAIESECNEFRWLKEHGWFPKKSAKPDPLRFEACDLIKRLPDEVMPAHLRDYVCGVLSQTPRDLKRTYAAGRDLYIADAVYHVMKRGFHPTRSSASRDKGLAESACSIVQKALARAGVTISERMVEDIWFKSGPEILPE